MRNEEQEPQGEEKKREQEENKAQIKAAIAERKQRLIATK